LPSLRGKLLKRKKRLLLLHAFSAALEAALALPFPKCSNCCCCSTG
jgi:hypothetical protein